MKYMEVHQVKSYNKNIIDGINGPIEAKVYILWHCGGGGAEDDEGHQLCWSIIYISIS